MKYDELVKALRETSMDFGELDDVSVMLLDADDAIETLMRQVENLERALRRDGEWQSTQN